jgi:hypothetical protein
MRRTQLTQLMALACFCLLGAMVPSAGADEWDKKTVFTFSAPVEIPGQALSPGTYVFKLLNTQADRHVVQVFDKDETHLYGTFLTIPDYRMKPPSKPLVLFEERPAGAPQAIKAWFYPGDNFGNEFVYPKTRAVELANRNQQNVPSMPNNLKSNTTTAPRAQNSSQVSEMKAAPLKAEKPSGEEVEVTEVFLVAIPETAETPTETASAHPNAQKQLPKTASQLPLLGVIGLSLLAAGCALRVRSARVR